MPPVAATMPTTEKFTQALAGEHRQAGLLWCISLVIALIYTAAYFGSYTPPVMFVGAILAVYASAPPKYLYSPRNFLAGYHMMFYGISVMSAERYSDMDFSERAVVLSYLMVATSYVACYLTLFHTETWLGGQRWVASLTPPAATSRKRSFTPIVLVLGAGLACAFGMVQASGGIEHWLRDAGRAFLGREGGGIYYLGFIMCMGIGTCAAGVFAARSRNVFAVPACLLLIVACVPLLGGKQRLFTMLAYTTLPWMFCASVMSRSTLYLISGVVASFTVLTYIRNMSWMTADNFIGYSLNYFSTFDNLVMSIRDFQPSWFQTMFLPFNKFLTPFGIGDNSVFYDMNAWLTSVYLPHIWDLRCTEQWPVETDLYLSLHYVYGVPLLMLYVGSTGLLFNLAVRSQSAGLIYVSAYSTFYMVSHLRCSLIIWTDFYTIPYWIVAYWILKEIRMPDVRWRLQMPAFLLSGVNRAAWSPHQPGRLP